MSVPAERLPAPRHVGRRPRGAPRARPATAPSRPSSRNASATASRAARRRVARRVRPAFWALTAVILTALVVALVSVSALVVETGFGIDRSEARIAELLDEGERLRMDVAAMSAPNRIATWAKSRGLVMPEEVVVLPMRATSADRVSRDDGA